jgi:hypothetical protein
MHPFLKAPCRVTVGLRDLLNGSLNQVKELPRELKVMGTGKLSRVKNLIGLGLQDCEVSREVVMEGLERECDILVEEIGCTKAELFAAFKDLYHF